MGTQTNGDVRLAVDAANVDLTSLRDASFRYVREKRPGDMPQAQGRSGVDDTELTLPEAEETRYILEKLKLFADTYAAAIPDIVRERAPYFDPPIEAPSAAQIVVEPDAALRSLESISRHLKFDPEDQKVYERLLEDVRYVVESSSRAILGLGKEDRTEYQHVLRTLSSATRSFSRFLDPIEHGLQKIPIPDPPPLALPDGNVDSLNPDDKAKVRRPLKELLGVALEGIANTAGYLYRRARAGVVHKWEEFGSWCKRQKDWLRLQGSRLVDALRPVGHGIAVAWGYGTFPIRWSWRQLKAGVGLLGAGITGGAALAKDACVGGWKWAATNVYPTVARKLSRFADRHPRVVKGLIVASAAGMAGAAAIGYASLGIWMPFGITTSQLAYGAATVVGIGTALVVGWKAIKHFSREQVAPAAISFGHTLRHSWWGSFTNFVGECYAALTRTKLFHYLFARGRNPNQTRSYSLMSSDVMSYFKGGFRRLDRGCKIESQDQKFWDRMGVLDVHILEKKGGNTIQLRRFLDRCEQEPERREQVRELRRHIYRTKTFHEPDLADLGRDETKITVAATPGKMSLLLPLGYRVTGVCFIDKNGEPMKFHAPVEVEECALGGARIEVPFGVRHIKYTVRQDEFPVPPEQVERLVRLLPGIGTFRGIEGEAFAEAMSAFDMTKRDQVKLLFGHQADRGFKVVDDSFVRSFLDAAGNAVAESVGGMRLGHKDALSYYSAAMFNAHGVPAVLISGLIPDAKERTYSMSTGHSQTAVLTEEGALVCDLSDKAQALDQTGSGALLRSERVGLMQRLNGMNYHQVFDFSSEVREVVTSEGKELSFFNNLMNALFEWRGFGLPFLNRTYRDKKLARSVVTDFDRMAAPKEESAVKALAKKIALDRTLEYGRKQGSVAQVHQFYAENHHIPQISDAARGALPEEHRDIEGYDVRGQVVRFTAESLVSEQFTALARRNSIDWVVKRLPRQAAVIEYGQGRAMDHDLNTYFYTKKDEILTARELVALLTPAAIEKLNSSQAKDLLFGTLALPCAPIERNGRKNFVAPEIAPDTLAELSDRALRLAEKVESGRIPFSRAEKEAVAVLSAKLGNALIAAQKARGVDPGAASTYGESVRKCARSIALITDLGGNAQVPFFFDLLMESQSKLAPELVNFAKTVGRDAIFGCRNGEKEIALHLETLGLKVTRAFCERQLADQNFQNWWQTLSFFESLGMPAATHTNTDRIKRHMERELRREARRGDINIGYPDESSRPFSFLCARLLNSPSANRVKIGRELEVHGLLKSGDLREIWPEIPESSVFAVLTKNAKQLCENEPPDLGFGGNGGRLNVAGCPALASELVGADLRPLAAVLNYNLLAPGARDWAATAVESIRDKFPREWKHFTAQFTPFGRARLVERVVSDFYRGIPTQDVYRGVLGFAAASLVNDATQGTERTLSALTAAGMPGGAATQEAACAPAVEFMTPCDSMKPPFNGLSARAALAAVITTRFLVDFQKERREKHEASKEGDWSLFKLFSRHKTVQTADLSDRELAEKEATRLKDLNELLEGEFRDTRRLAVQRILQDSFGLSFPLCRIAERPLSVQGPTPEAAVWRELFSPPPYYGQKKLDFEALEKDSHSRAELLKGRFRENLSQFLYSRAGCVLVSADSGDFKGYRDYGRGDSPARIDWKRSVRDGKYSVRMKDEDETRGLRFVFDEEFLLQAYKDWSTGTLVSQQNEFNPLRDLYIICHLAARENVQIDVVLYSRACQANLEGVVRQSRTNPRGHFDVKKLSSELERHLRGAAEIFEAEKAIFGEEGLAGVDVFGARDLPVRDGQIHLFGISPRNQADAYAQRGNMKRRRILTATIQDAHRTAQRGEMNG